MAVSALYGLPSPSGAFIVTVLHEYLEGHIEGPISTSPMSSKPSHRSHLWCRVLQASACAWRNPQRFCISSRLGARTLCRLRARLQPPSWRTAIEDPIIPAPETQRRAVLVQRHPGELSILQDVQGRRSEQLAGAGEPLRHVGKADVTEHLIQGLPGRGSLTSIMGVSFHPSRHTWRSPSTMGRCQR